jgi:hypothetical protein
MKLKLLALTGFVIASMLPALAHSPRPASRAMIADAGDYHVEVTANGSSLVVLLTDQADKPVAAEGHKGMAIFVIDGKAQRISLEPAGHNKLTGTAAMAMPARLKGAVQITKPDGNTVQAKF